MKEVRMVFKLQFLGNRIDNLNIPNNRRFVDVPSGERVYLRFLGR